MISMEMMGKIRRMYFRDKLSLHEIAKRTGLSRNTIRKWVRASESQITAFVRHWRGEQGKAVRAFVPLAFALGEAFQFDWSE